MKWITGCVLAVLAGGFLLVAPAGAETEAEREAREMAEIQKKLNAEVMAKPFSVEEMAKIDAYIEQAMKSNLVPPTYTGTQPWRRGMTCAHLGSYIWRRNCRYHYRYYGYYYPY